MRKTETPEGASGKRGKTERKEEEEGKCEEVEEDAAEDREKGRGEDRGEGGED